MQCQSLPIHKKHRPNPVKQEYNTHLLPYTTSSLPPLIFSVQGYPIYLNLSLRICLDLVN